MTPTPVLRGMELGRIVRIEELTRIAPEVQDALISPLSDKTMAIPELSEAVDAQPGFNLIATANLRDRGTHTLSAALERRFNFVALPPPATLADEVAIIVARLRELGPSLALAATPPDLEDIRRIATVLRELRELRDGAAVLDDAADPVALRRPSGGLSTADAISAALTVWSETTHFVAGDVADDAADSAVALPPDRIAQALGRRRVKRRRGRGGGGPPDPSRIRGLGLSAARAARRGGLAAAPRSDRRASRGRGACVSLSARDAARLVVFGVRHHRARFAIALERALAGLDPALVLIEGPPEASPLLPLAGAHDMIPPVALAAMARGAPETARWFPFAAFSPEWRALRWALAAERPVRFIDLPLAVRLADPALDERRADQEAADPGDDWWEKTVEPVAASADPLNFFAAVGAAAAELRQGEAGLSRLDQWREAAMRRSVRAALRDAPTGVVVVVCGVWHAPALESLKIAGSPTARADADLLRGAPRRLIDVSWIAWSEAALARDPADRDDGVGYAAGPAAPGWEAHLWETRAAPEASAARWMASTARALRAESASASPAAALDAARLAEALAALRRRSSPGLDELRDASVAALARGDPQRLAAAERRLVLGDRIGHVAAAAPHTPLAGDVAATARRLRTPLDASGRRVHLDLRKPSGQARAVFFRRLVLIGGLPADALLERVDLVDPTRRRGPLGGFREIWRMGWPAERAAALAIASALGPSLAIAAEASAIKAARAAVDVAEAAAIAERVRRSGRAAST